uniref:Uncharacterized protein n=1 Tax=Ascaris lumbricoides TaxID=6252 RepID=A0A9J2PTH6_ASCLU
MRSPEPHVAPMQQKNRSSPFLRYAPRTPHRHLLSPSASIARISRCLRRLDEAFSVLAAMRSPDHVCTCACMPVTMSRDVSHRRTTKFTVMQFGVGNLHDSIAINERCSSDYGGYLQCILHSAPFHLTRRFKESGGSSCKKRNVLLIKYSLRASVLAEVIGLMRLHEAYITPPARGCTPAYIARLRWPDVTTD